MATWHKPAGRGQGLGCGETDSARPSGSSLCPGHSGLAALCPGHLRRVQPRGRCRGRQAVLFMPEVHGILRDLFHVPLQNTKNG